jgi:hypothetical protein
MLSCLFQNTLPEGLRKTNLSKYLENIKKALKTTLRALRLTSEINVSNNVFQPVIVMWQFLNVSKASV